MTVWCVRSTGAGLAVTAEAFAAETAASRMAVAIYGAESVGLAIVTGSPGAEHLRAAHIALMHREFRDGPGRRHMIFVAGKRGANEGAM